MLSKKNANPTFPNSRVSHKHTAARAKRIERGEKSIEERTETTERNEKSIEETIKI
ncbi:hypothetical protein GCM10028778_22360 [Barrientosiimonas marina]